VSRSYTSGVDERIASRMTVRSSRSNRRGEIGPGGGAGPGAGTRTVGVTSGRPELTMPVNRTGGGGTASATPGAVWASGGGGGPLVGNPADVGEPVFRPAVREGADGHVPRESPALHGAAGHPDGPRGGRGVDPGLGNGCGAHVTSLAESTMSTSIAE